jgi:hypothetical protein
VATLKYTGTIPTTFHDVTSYVTVDDIVIPVTARVGELQPDQVFSVPDDCAEPFLRRSDIEEYVPEDEVPAEEEPADESAKPRQRRVKITPGDEDLGAGTAPTTE